MKILSAISLKAGATTEYNRFGAITQPIQFLSKDRKTYDWVVSNMDWWELQGIRQIKSTGKRLLKNIRLAKGIIDNSDYMLDDDNENSDMMGFLTEKESPAMNLKFFPIIPTVINILKAEFAKRNSKLMFVGKDSESYNELLEAKRGEIEKYLMSTETAKMQQMLIEAGMDPESEEFQQQMDEGNIKNLPQIQAFFEKDYQSLIAEWAQHQKQADDKRFNMRELETNQFEYSLTCDREFWHYKMGENDYTLEEWDPVFSYIFKSQKTKYFSNGSAGGHIEFLTVADVIDNYGYLMNTDQIQSLENISGNRNGADYNRVGATQDSMYDSSKSHDWNTKGPSLGMRQLTSFKEDFVYNNEGLEDLFNIDDETFDRKNCLRVTTNYWKSQRRLFHLTKITHAGETIQKIVDEDYKVTTNPVYNMKLFKERTEESLMVGEHLEELWINDTYGGVKIGRGRGLGRTSSTYDFDPIYLGIDKKEPGRLRFQFKGDDSLYGCKLPIEGTIFSGSNTKSTCIVDLMSPPQINYNMVNNQISDILIDEIGPVAMIDQNALPKHSLGEDWGPGNYVKANQAMRYHKILPLDTSAKNLEGTTNFNQYGMLNFDETSRLMSRINLSRHFKEQCMEVIGITPQRVGQVQASETAQGTETAVQNSYAQTEMLFIQHCDWLMPRVHTMRTDLAQYYHSKNPSLRLQYVTSMDEKVNFQMNTTGMLAKDVGVYCTTEINSRDVLNQMKKYFISNNQQGGNLHDLAGALKAGSLAEMDRITNASQKRAQAEMQQKQAHEEKMNQDQIAAAAAEKQAQRDWDAEQNQADRVYKLEGDKIRSAGMPATDIQKDGQDDYIQRMQYLQKDTQFNDKLNFDREKEANKNLKDMQSDQLKREELRSKEKVAQTAFQIARENQTRSELIAKNKIKATSKK